MTNEFSKNNDCGQGKSKAFVFQSAMFPIIMSCCAFVCFLLVYLLFTVWTINPLYLVGLIFIFPSLVFALIAFFAGKGKIGSQITNIITGILIPVFVLGSLFCIFNIGLSQTSATITNVSRYERTIKYGSNSKKEQLAAFPRKIPGDAINASFYYNASGWMESSQTVFLQFSASQETIDGYVEQFSKSAIQKANANVKGVFDRVAPDYIKDLPSDYDVYVIINEGSHNRKVCAVSISEVRNNVIFYAYEMIW